MHLGGVLFAACGTPVLKHTTQDASLVTCPMCRNIAIADTLRALGEVSVVVVVCHKAAKCYLLKGVMSISSLNVAERFTRNIKDRRKFAVVAGHGANPKVFRRLCADSLAVPVQG